MSITGGTAKKNTFHNYELVVIPFCEQIGERDLESVTPEEVLSFLTRLTEGAKQSTKSLRYGLLSAFFNFTKNSLDPSLPNPCETPILRKVFRHPKPNQWKILEKEAVDEIIFRTRKPRDRIMLELMARGGMRISEVLKITPQDVEERRIVLRDPKSGREAEIVFIPQRVADRLQHYIREKRIGSGDRVFPISYTAARMAVKKAGLLIGVKLTPHDLRRHAATYASRSGTPIEIVSKVILRHANLSTTQRYLGKVSDVEALKWIENLYG